MANFPADDDENEPGPGDDQLAAADVDDAVEETEPDGIDALTTGITSTLNEVVSRARADEQNASEYRRRAPRAKKAAPAPPPPAPPPAVVAAPAKAAKPAKPAKQAA